MDPSNQSSLASEAVFEAVARDHAIVPTLWHFEVAGVLAKHRKAGTISREEVESSLREIESLDIRVDRQPPSLIGLLRIAETYALTGYDSAYLDLAERSAAPLATLDRRLLSAAKLAGITVVSL